MADPLSDFPYRIANGPGNLPDADEVMADLDHLRDWLNARLGNLTSGQFLVGNASGVATPRALSGDGTLSNTGLLTIANGAITTAKIGGQQVDSTKIANDGVTTAKIADDAVTSTKLDANAVATASIQDLAVTTPKINDNAVGAGKIVDGAIINSKLGDLSVSTGKLQNNSVTSPKVNLSTAQAVSGASPGLTTTYQSVISLGTLAAGVWLVTAPTTFVLAGTGDSGFARISGDTASEVKVALSPQCGTNSLTPASLRTVDGSTVVALQVRVGAGGGGVVFDNTASQIIAVRIS